MNSNIVRICKTRNVYKQDGTLYRYQKIIVVKVMGNTLIAP
jgi:hypothetical protein